MRCKRTFGRGQVHPQDGVAHSVQVAATQPLHLAARLAACCCLLRLLRSLRLLRLLRQWLPNAPVQACQGEGSRARCMAVSGSLGVCAN